MKVLFSACILLCFAGSVYMQNVTQDCGSGNTCSADLVCEMGKCRVMIEGTCTANSTDQCVMTAAPCPENGKCKCPTDAGANPNKTACACTDSTNKVFNMDKTKCVSKVGQGCSGEGDCLAYGQCTNSTCACKASYYNAKSDNSKCSRKVEGDCSDRAECPMNGNCDDKKCMCMTNYAATFDMLKCRLLPGQKCMAAGDCGENALCNGTQICACKPNFTNQEGKRCGKIENGDCTAHGECVPNATCKNKKCKCKGTSDDKGFCSGASAVAASFVLLLAALVSSRWI